MTALQVFSSEFAIASISVNAVYVAAACPRFATEAITADLPRVLSTLRMAGAAGQSRGRYNLAARGAAGPCLQLPLAVPMAVPWALAMVWHGTCEGKVL